MTTPAHQLSLARTPKRVRFEHGGLLAIEPKAFYDWFFVEPNERVNEQRDGAVIVDISGPLYQRDDGWCDSYEAILSRVQQACESAAKVVVLRIDSPGGDAAGCFETARALRATCEAHGKTLVAFVDGKACSAAYALASAASRIALTETSLVGSIGVINTREDITAMDASRGIKVVLTTSGARKADGHPHLPISDAEQAATQKHVDELAEVFFALVAEMRGSNAAAIKALEAGVFYGASAKEAGLADEVTTTLESLLASIASQGDVTMATKATKYEDARAALEEAAKGDGEDAKRAKRALAAMDDEGDEKPKPKEDDDEAASEEGDDEKPKPKEDDDEAASEEGDDEKPKDDKPAARVSASTAAELGAKLSAQGKRLAKLEKERETEARAAFLATRPDLDKDLLGILKDKPIAEVKAIVNAIAKPKKANPAAAASAVGTRGDSQHDDGAARLSPDAKHALDVRMGLVASKPGVKNESHRLILGTPVSSASGAAAEKGA